MPRTEFLRTPRFAISVVVICCLAGVVLAGAQGTGIGSTGPQAQGCQVPRYQPSPDASVASEDNFPYQDWIANSDAQAAVANVNSQLSNEFASPGVDDGSAALKAGLIGVAVDHYNHQFDVVVDPALVDPGALKAELQAIADEAGKGSGSASAEGLDPADSSPLTIKVIGGCSSSSELLHAQAVIDKRAWSPDASEASYAVELDPATSTYHVTISEKYRSTADALKAELGDLVTIDFDDFFRADGGRLSDNAPHWGGAKIRHPANDPTHTCTSGFVAELPGGNNGAVTAGHCGPNGNDFFADGFFGEASGRSDFPEFDMERLHGAGQTSYARKLHVDPCCPSVRDVVSASNPDGVGSFVCASGYITRAVCGLEVQSMDAQGCDAAGCTPNLFRAQKNDDIIAAGDSGGPVYNRFDPGDAAIRGMIVGGVGHENLYAHKVNTIKTHLDVTRIGQ